MTEKGSDNAARAISLCLRAIRRATEPTTTRDIANIVTDARGLNAAQMVTHNAQTAGACIWKLKQSEYVSEIAGIGVLECEYGRIYPHNFSRRESIRFSSFDGL